MSKRASGNATTGWTTTCTTRRHTCKGQVRSLLCIHAVPLAHSGRRCQQVCEVSTRDQEVIAWDLRQENSRAVLLFLLAGIPLQLAIVFDCSIVRHLNFVVG